MFTQARGTLFSRIGVALVVYVIVGVLVEGNPPPFAWNLPALTQIAIYIFVKIFGWPLWVLAGHPTVKT